jgi:hypothetical protein
MRALLADLVLEDGSQRVDLPAMRIPNLTPIERQP